MKKSWITDGLVVGGLAVIGCYGKSLQDQVALYQREYDFLAGQLSDGAYAVFCSYILYRNFSKLASLMGLNPEDWDEELGRDVKNRINGSFSLVLAFGGCVAYELIQPLMAGRTFDLRDIVAYGVGAICGTGIGWLCEPSATKPLSLEQRVEL